MSIIITHGGCPDGVAAAYVLQKKYPKARVYPSFVRGFAEDKQIPALYGEDLIIVDYSYPPDVIKMLCGVCHTVTIYDHHVTAQPLQELCFINLKVVIDMTLCGAEIAWREEFPNEQPWWMVHIRDRDLWLWDHPQSHAFSEAFSDIGINAESLSKIDKFTEEEKMAFYAHGQSIYNFRMNLYGKICDSAEYVTFQGYKVYAINTTAFQSDIGNILAKRLGADFSVIYRYSISARRWYVSLRGTKHSPNLAELAKKLGEECGLSGGGHRRAAGFEYIGNFPSLFSN